jgi:hypothetical protein
VLVHRGWFPGALAEQTTPHIGFFFLFVTIGNNIYFAKLCRKWNTTLLAKLHSIL